MMISFNERELLAKTSNPNNMYIQLSRNHANYLQRNVSSVF